MHAFGEHEGFPFELRVRLGNVREVTLSLDGQGQEDEDDRVENDGA